MPISRNNRKTGKRRHKISQKKKKEINAFLKQQKIEQLSKKMQKLNNSVKELQDNLQNAIAQIPIIQEEKVDEEINPATQLDTENK